MLQPREFFDDIEVLLFDYIPVHRQMLDVMEVNLAELRDSYHEAKEKVRESKVAALEKKYMSNTGKRTARVSRVVIRLFKRNITDRKNLKKYNPGVYYQAYLYRSIGKNQYEYINRRKKNNDYNFKTIYANSANRVSLEEKDMLEHYVAEVNLYNHKVNALKDNFLQHLITVDAFTGVI